MVLDTFVALVVSLGSLVAATVEDWFERPSPAGDFDRRSEHELRRCVDDPTAPGC